MVKTYNDLYLETRRTLRQSDEIEDAALEARLILCQALDCSASELLARSHMYVGEEVTEKVRRMTERRRRGEPAAYIAGSWEFFGLPMIVDRSVLIPRMDTEVLVRKAIDTLRGRKMNARVLDLCCGSGCIGCAIGKNLPATRLIMADISPAALSVTRRNIALHQLSGRSVIVQADALRMPPLRLGNVDLIVCNPPYIPTAEIRTLDDSVKDWEPVLALDGGEDGLMFYRSVIDKWLSVLSDSGYVIFEVGEEQAGPVFDLMYRAGLKGLDTVRDTAGTERVVCGYK